MPCKAVTFTLDPFKTTVATGSTVEISMLVSDFTNVGAFQMSLFYDPSVFQLNSVTETGLPNVFGLASKIGRAHV